MTESVLMYPVIDGSALRFGRPLSQGDEDIILFGFVEEAPPEGMLPADEAIREYVLSAVDAYKFDQIESDFGSCDPSNDGQRLNRRKLLTEHYGSPESIWNLHLPSPRDGVLGRYLDILLRPSTWHVVVLSPDTRVGIIVRRESEESDDEGRATEYGLTGLAPVHPYTLLRLDEVFSLNHIPDSDLGPTDSGFGAPSPFDPENPEPKPPTPGSRTVRHQNDGRERKTERAIAKKRQRHLGED